MIKSVPLESEADERAEGKGNRVALKIGGYFYCMLSVRELEAADLPNIIDYWTSASAEHLGGMGVDVSKMPSVGQWNEMLADQLAQPYELKESYCLIWELEGQPIGHCNVTNIVFGEQAYMHLHVWNPADRGMGYGSNLVQLSIPYFFRNLKLQRLFSAPYALNPAPNRTLERAGFRFVKEYTGIPGSFSFEQQAKLWKVGREQFIDN